MMDILYKNINYKKLLKILNYIKSVEIFQSFKKLTDFVDRIKRLNLVEF